MNIRTSHVLAVLTPDHKAHQAHGGVARSQYGVAVTATMFGGAVKRLLRATARLGPAAATGARQGTKTASQLLAGPGVCQPRSNAGYLWALAAGTSAAMWAAAPAMAAGREELTFIMVKPDGVHRGLISDIIKRFEQKGYKLVGIKILVPNRDLASKHYAEHDGKPFFPKLVNFLSSGPVVAMVWEGKEVVKYGRTMIGATNPLASAPGTIRGDYGIDVGRNIIHGSDSPESAKREVALWFEEKELASWDPVSSTWVYE